MTSINFSSEIIYWYLEHKRDLPWRNSQDPYVIWLSEIILQQTRVEQGLPYFYKFIEALPNIKNFAEADEHDILKLWQGLGYYSRARNMHYAARQITENHNCRFPDSFEKLRQLKGVGDYTAAAIASFAFNLPHAVVDGNVYRFLSRYSGIKTPVDSNRGKKEFSQLANKLLSKESPAAHNQAMMEIGATICKPKNPECPECPVNKGCIALKKNLINHLPVKSKKTVVRNRYFHYLFILYKNYVVIRKRTSNDIWKNMYDLPLIETTERINPEKLFLSEAFNSLMNNTNFTIKKITPVVIHKLTHQHLYTTFISLRCREFNAALSDDMQMIPVKRLNSFAFPRLIDNYLKEEKITG